MNKGAFMYKDDPELFLLRKKEKFNILINSKEDN